MLKLGSCYLERPQLFGHMAPQSHPMPYGTSITLFNSPSMASILSLHASGDAMEICTYQKGVHIARVPQPTIMSIYI